MSLVHAINPSQDVSDAFGKIHPDLLRWLQSLASAVNKAAVPENGIVFASLSAANVSAYFDANGLGDERGPYDGWAICNGNNGTPDLTDSMVRADVAGAGGSGEISSGAGQAYQELVPLMRLGI